MKLFASKHHEIINVSMPSDANGFSGRECPYCEQYFKLNFETGLEDNVNCICPYCGHQDTHEHFHTEALFEYVESLTNESDPRYVRRHIRCLGRALLPRRKPPTIVRPRHSGRPSRIRYPSERDLETDIECTNCSLKYAVYGVYAYCPDCARHNSVQILDNNLEISVKLLELSSSNEATLANTLLRNSLTDVVASFDGFGREICRANASKSSDMAQAEKIRFQNLQGAQSNILRFFGIDISAGLTSQEWEMAIRCFQKRHLLEHKSGVVDEEYKSKAKDPQAIVGRKVRLSKDEVRLLIDAIRGLGAHIYAEMEKLP